VRCVFAGTPEVAVVSLAALLDSRHEVVAVVTRPDAAAGRGRHASASPVAEHARGAGIDVLTPQSPRDPAFIEAMRALAPDCAPVVAYGGLIPPELLGVPRLGWVNLHFSLLPQWRGAAPVQRAIWHGDDVTGASVFALEAGLDTGPLFGSVTESIRSDDTAGDLLARLAVSGAGLLVATLDALDDGRVHAVRQAGEPTFAPKIAVEDARIRWGLPAVGVDRQVRACTPKPGAWTELGGERVRIHPVRIDPVGPVLDPGVVAITKKTVRVGTATHPVLLGDVQPAGKRVMSAADWARGARLSDGTSFT
jgi:methionyl-tRNA formyltransferase